MNARAVRVAVIGGGPAGLYLARLLRLRGAHYEVEVFERNPAGSTFGFGVAFSQATLANLQAADRRTHDALLAASRGWDGMMLRHGGRAIRWAGFGLDAISRAALLELLHDAALDAGATVRFDAEVGLDDVRDADVIVAADGANSPTRTAMGTAFGPSAQLGRAKYMWLGSTGPFDRTTFCVRRSSDSGTFAIHAYPYAESRATLVAEADEESWRRAGLAAHAERVVGPGASDEESARFLAELFADDLDGHEVLVNNSKWLNFPTIGNDRWSSGKVVLIGDAAHTAHPSVASGTKLAMEDAIALADELASGRDLPEALARYEARRRPDVEHVQRRAARSQRWWETLHTRVDMTPEQLAFSYLTRAGAVDFHKLDRIAPTLTAEALSRLSPEVTDEARLAEGPLAVPVEVAGRRFAGRLLRPASRDRDAEPDVWVVAVGDGGGDATLAMVRDARASAVPGIVIGAEVRLVQRSGAVDVEATVDCALRLGAAGCDLIALPRSDRVEMAEIAERIRLAGGLATLGQCNLDELDRAATDVLAGRIDLVEVVANGTQGPGGARALAVAGPEALQVTSIASR